MNTLQQLIVDTSTNYIGQKEIIGNLGFIDVEFQQKMEAVGWESKEAWCSYFAELVWREAYAQLNSEIEAKIRPLFNKSAVTTYNNFRRSEFAQYVTKKAEPGSVAIFRSAGSTWQGHAGIVLMVKNSEMLLVEGNTNASGGREGIEVARKSRLIDFSTKEKGLILIGFINPIPY